jgi:hypothetical protein
MRNTDEIMVVYVVAGRIDFEGEDFSYAGKVFSDHQDALDYGKQLIERGYDGYVVREAPVE